MKTLLTLVFFLFGLIVDGCFGQIIINEGSNKNYSTISDEDGDFEDWIELHNAGTNSVDLYQIRY